jgi:hypothetical protein
VEFRKTNIRYLKIQITNLKGQIQAIKLKFEKLEPAKQESLQPQLDALVGEGLRKVEIDYSGEQQILSQVMERLSAITPERKKNTARVIKERRAEAHAAKEKFTEAQREYQALEKRVRDQEAHYYRKELLNFIRLERNRRTGRLTRRYAYNPRNLANALAGLPRMNCRRSATRLAKHPYSWEPSTIYKVFEFLERLQRERVLSNPDAAIEIVPVRINELPKTEPIPEVYRDRTDKKRRENFLRRYLQENWAFLKPAIEYGMRSGKHPGQVPYLITAKFQGNLAKPRSQADILFAEQERLLG